MALPLTGTFTSSGPDYVSAAFQKTPLVLLCLISFSLQADYEGIAHFSPQTPTFSAQKLRRKCLPKHWF